MKILSIIVVSLLAVACMADLAEARCGRGIFRGRRGGCSTCAAPQVRQAAPMNCANGQCTPARR